MMLLRRLQFIAHRVEDSVLIFALLSMLVMALTQIVMRNLFDSGFLWAESFLRILVLWVAMLGAMVASREQNHISIDLVSRLMREASFRWIRGLAQLFAAGICLVTAYYSIEFITYEYEDGTIAFADVPVWVCQSILPIGFSIMGLRFLWGILFTGPTQAVSASSEESLENG